MHSKEYFKDYNLKRQKARKEYRDAHKDELRAYGVRHQLSLKMTALDAYGGPKCACCGEDLIEGLTIDHVGGDGARHRKNEKSAGRNLYAWLKKNGYPPGFQVLCGTCNTAKGTKDHCPHQDKLDKPDKV